MIPGTLRVFRSRWQRYKLLVYILCCTQLSVWSNNVRQELSLWVLPCPALGNGVVYSVSNISMAFLRVLVWIHTYSDAHTILKQWKCLYLSNNGEISTYVTPLHTYKRLMWEGIIQEPCPVVCITLKCVILHDQNVFTSDDCMTLSDFYVNSWKSDFQMTSTY